MNTKTFQESFELLNDFLTGLGLPQLSEKEASTDWSIVGGESISELEMLARDYASEMHTLKCEERDAWRYEH